MIVWSVILFFSAIGFVYLFSDTLRQYLAFDKIVQLNVGCPIFERERDEGERGRKKEREKERERIKNHFCMHSVGVI